ncbi:MULTISPECIES: STAS-like domain-containing protein [Helicobacter]|nr:MULTISPECIES: STAS-like domain-containing protein [Helicobacter]
MQQTCTYALKVQDVCGCFEFLGSRDSGEKLHSRIVELLGSQENKDMKLELDFNGVCGVAHAFADEVFGLLFARFGVEYIKTRIVLSNANDTIKSMINFAIKERIKKARDTNGI